MDITFHFQVSYAIPLRLLLLLSLCHNLANTLAGFQRLHGYLSKAFQCH